MELSNKLLTTKEYLKIVFEGNGFFVLLGFLSGISVPILSGIREFFGISGGEEYANNIFIDHMPVTTMSILMLASVILIGIAAVSPNKFFHAWGTDKAILVINRLVEYSRVSVCLMLGLTAFLPMYWLITDEIFYFYLTGLLLLVSFQFIYVPFVLYQLAHTSKETEDYWKRSGLVVLAIIISAIMLYLEHKIG